MLDLERKLLDQRLDPGTFSSHGGERRTRPYISSPALDTAAALSIILCQPLLLSGAPGVGKTGAAYHIAARVLKDGGDPIRLTVTSQTAGRDLLYHFDSLARFRAKSSEPLRSFLRFEALGRAIASACGATALVRDSASGEPIVDVDRIWRICGRKSEATSAPLVVGDLLPPNDPLGATPVDSVVLIDEIDKAPRDTPNDLLESFEAMRFTIEELGVTIGVDAAATAGPRPIVVCTTNAENSLPDAFLRRCVFHEIPLPDAEQMRRIIAANLRIVTSMDENEADVFAAAAQATGAEVGKRIAGASRPPGTAEYVALARALRAAGVTSADCARAVGNVPRLAEAQARAVLGVMVKTAEDMKAALPAILAAAA